MHEMRLRGKVDRFVMLNIAMNATKVIVVRFDYQCLSIIPT